MHEPAHAGRVAGIGQFMGQLDVHTFELGHAAVQDRHQVDHRISALHQPVQFGGAVHVGLHHTHRRQQLQVFDAGRPAARHHDLPAGAAGALDQLVAHAATDEA